MFAYLMSRAGNHLELIAYKAAAQVKVRMSDFMYTLCSKEAESEVAEETNKPAARLRRGAKIQHKLFGKGIISNLPRVKSQCALRWSPRRCLYPTVLKII